MSFVAVDRSRYTFEDEREVLSDKAHFIYIGHLHPSTGMAHPVQSNRFV